LGRFGEFGRFLQSQQIMPLKISVAVEEPSPGSVARSGRQMHEERIVRCGRSSGVATQPAGCGGKKNSNTREVGEKNTITLNHYK